MVFNHRLLQTHWPVLYFFEGDFFRKLWGPYAGWAQSVSVIVEYLSTCFCHASYGLSAITTECFHLFQVLFCADLKKFQKLKEMSLSKQPQKEEHVKEEMVVACEKTKIKTEENKTVKDIKTKAARHKKAKSSV